MIRWAGVALAALLIPIYLAVATPGAPARSNPAADRAFEAVVTRTFDPTHPGALFPKDFEQVMGYRPRTAIGPLGVPILYAPNGDCSSPTGPTEYDFDLVCKEHDLAYDVVRYAGRVGAPLPMEARERADDMFQSELHATCDAQQVNGASAALCHTFAQSFAWAVMINSWRQSYHSPENEDLLTPFAYTLLLVAILAPFWIYRRRPGREPWGVPPLPTAALAAFAAATGSPAAPQMSGGADLTDLTTPPPA